MRIGDSLNPNMGYSLTRGRATYLPKFEIKARTTCLNTYIIHMHMLAWSIKKLREQPGSVIRVVENNTFKFVVEKDEHRNPKPASQVAKENLIISPRLTPNRR